MPKTNADGMPVDKAGEVLPSNVFDVIDEHGNPVPLPTEPPPYMRFSEMPHST